MKKYLLLNSLFVTFVFLYSPLVLEAEEQQITLRSLYSDLTVHNVQALPNIFIYKIHDYGFYGSSTIKHNYEAKTIDEDNVIIDHSTGLMWHQSGSEEQMDWQKAKQWVSDLNKSGYAGHNDWRLPTVEEAVSLLKFDREKTLDLNIDASFNDKQTSIWSGDENDTASYLDGVWSVNFIGSYGSGYVRWQYENAGNHVRPVRSIK